MYLFNKLKKKFQKRFNLYDFVGRQGIRSNSDNGEYVASVKNALGSYSVFAKFKRDPRYQVILEHTSKAQGEACLKIIRAQSPGFIDEIDKFKINDLVGNPTTFEYPEIGRISPTTLRYMKVASDLRTLFGSAIGNRVAEIGVGYGGQALVLDQIFTINEYCLFDLPPVLELTSKYLESHILNLSYHTLTLNQALATERYDLVISNYAFSELPKVLQRKYIDKVLAHASKGYLTMNSGRVGSAAVDGTNKLSLEELRVLLPHFEVFEEEPYTSPQNYIIVWGHF